MLKTLFKPKEENHITQHELLTENLNLLVAIQAHLQWKSKLQGCITEGRAAEGKLDPTMVCRDDHCVLGKWIHSHGRQAFHHYPVFHELSADHAHFHQLAGKIVELVQTKNVIKAKDLLEGDYGKASRKVIRSITELNKVVQQAN